MSKSMAIEGVMKIFLMVAVIIVGMSFLLKAFGIDLIGWLQNLFGGFGIEDGKILYMRLDPGDNEVFSVYLTNNPIQKIDHETTLVGTNDYFAYFVVDKDTDKFKKNCVVYTVDEVSSKAFSLTNRDEAFIYYTMPGTIIQETCTSLGECLPDKREPSKSNCVEEKERSHFCEVKGAGLGDLDICYQKKKGPFSTVNCYCESRVEVIPNEKSKCEDSKKDVETFPFNRQITRKGDCELKDGTPKTPNKCNLLVPEDIYRIKYGLLCGADGLWHVCKDSAKSDFQGGDCDFNGGVGIWTSKIPQPTPRNPPSNVLLRFIPTTGTTVNLQFSLIISAEDKDSDLSVLHLNLDDQGDKKGKCESAETRSDLEDSDRTLRFTCSGNSCQTSWKIKCSVAGTYKFQGQAVDSTGLSTTTNTASMLVQK